MIWSHAIGDAGYAAATRNVINRSRRVHLSNFLTEEASRALLGAMAVADWRVITNVGGATREFAPSEISPDEARAIASMLRQEAQESFRFIYDGYRLGKKVLAGDLTEGVLRDFFMFLNDPATLQFFRDLTGEQKIAKLDAMATRYRLGHFLTEHNDYEPGSDRLLAYVFNFCPVWRTDWGGWLTFYSEDGHVSEAYAPRWGSLNIFQVPMRHAVSQVSSFANADRYAITGWMRAATPQP